MSGPRSLWAGGTVVDPGALGPMRRSAGRTDAGKVRDHNEDSFLADDGRGVWAVSDGMGGHAGGAEASRSVIMHLSHVRTGWPTPRALALDVVGRLEDAHAAIQRASAAAGQGAAGATVCCLAVYGRHALLAWCGDSRIYRLHPAEGLRRVTHDHTVVQGLVDEGRIAPEDAETHPHAHVLTRAVGATPRLGLDFNQLTLRPGDRFLLCSDGLTRPVPEALIGADLSARRTPQAACDALIDRALEAGAPDNVTVVVVDFA